MKLTEKDKSELINQCGGDVRRLVTMCESLKLGSMFSSVCPSPAESQSLSMFPLSQKSHKSGGGIASFIKMSSKDTFMNNFNIIKHVLVNDKMKFDTSVALIQSDQSFITNMIQENYINLFILQYDLLQCKPSKDAGNARETQESVDVISRMSELCDDLSSVDMFNEISEIYQDDKDDARNISASWLNASIRCNRALPPTKSKSTRHLKTPKDSSSSLHQPHVDEFEVQPASCYARSTQLKTYSSQLQFFETSSVLGEYSGFLTFTNLNMFISLFTGCSFEMLKILLPNLEETNWNALMETRLGMHRRKGDLGRAPTKR